MKKLLAILLAAMMLLSLAACGDNNTTDPDKDNPGVSQSGENNNGGEEKQATESTPSSSGQSEDAGSNEVEIPTTGTPIGWPDNEYTKLVPTPDSGGKVLTSGEIGTLFAIELKWSMEQGLAYVQQLQEAGFGDDCVEKYQKQGTLDRTVNGVNVQVLDLFGVTSVSIMKVEE